MMLPTGLINTPSQPPATVSYNNSFAAKNEGIGQNPLMNLLFLFAIIS
jgi:hypothetical protein